MRRDLNVSSRGSDNENDDILPVYLACQNVSDQCRQNVNVSAFLLCVGTASTWLTPAHSAFTHSLCSCILDVWPCVVTPHYALFFYGKCDGNSECVPTGNG